jgi:hypothetical protein
MVDKLSLSLSLSRNLPMDDLKFIKRGALASAGTIALIIGVAVKRLRDRQRSTNKTVFVTKDDGEKKAARPAVNAKFFKQFIKLVRILIPGVFSAEFFYTFMVGALLGI